MKENLALLLRPDSAIDEITKWIDKYGIIIWPSESLAKKSILFSINYTIKRRLLERVCRIPSGNFGLSQDICIFSFDSHHEALAFIQDNHLVIGYDYIDDIK